MDTRFWGPSGWKLLHLASYAYDEAFSPSYANFFETIPYVLPCKFCRASLTDYYRVHPYSDEKGMIPTLDVKRWMYTIHNCVNGKLRKQGLHPEVNPTYASVTQYYRTLYAAPWGQQIQLLWDFLFAVAYHHPNVAVHSSPMPDCPKEVTCSSERNKWNVLPHRQRMYWYRRFWVFLPAVFPQELREKWQEVEKTNPPATDTRQTMMAWLWRMRCGLDTAFHDPYRTVCHKIAIHSSDCGTRKGGITCRGKTRKTKRGGK